MKKRWRKPQLTVLIRGRPEESVLFFCKLWWGDYTNPGSVFQCFLDDGSLCHDFTLS